MWPLILTFLRSNAVYITLPVAGVIGFIGYNLENLLSSKYTPYSKSIQENRNERLMEEITSDPLKHERLKLKENVLGRNLSPSLQEK
ncbi:small integral membrane protein 12 [Condylostylus longicornis]|uniref:small integral membrane protein 12 n=1 Tax=Condylostylus longicornis TaxID=2530218 RepID=UPI00244DB7C3|nr:small integral membrane protein 12 [Condylostylus longicornis]